MSHAKAWIRAALTTGLLTVASIAHAEPILIFNTGVNADGTPLADGTLTDPHYTLISVPAGTSTVRVLTSAGAYPFPYWLADNSFSAWIGPNNDDDANSAPGGYTYRTTFDLTGLNPTTASLIGQWAADDGGYIVVNGISTGSIQNGYSFWTPLSIAPDLFTSGINTLDFIINNDGTSSNPTGLRVEFSVATAMPLDVLTVREPMSLTLLATGLLALVGHRVARKT